MLRPTHPWAVPVVVQTYLRIGTVRRNWVLEHQSRRKDNPIEARKANKLERFPADCVCKSLSTVKM